MSGDEEKELEAERVLRSLNDAFCTSEPAAYLRTRLTSALQMPPDLRQVHDDPDSLRNQVLRRLPGWGVKDLTDPDEQAAVQVIEAFTLAHHAGEVLLRHVLAQLQSHLQRSSPWLALAALQQPRMFRDRCRRLLDAPEEELQAILTHVFLPHWDEIVQRCGEVEGAATRAYLSAWIRHFAGYYLDSSNGYNAVKHGLSGLPQHGRVSFFTDPETTGTPPVEVPMMAGAMLETLETHGKGHQQHWVRVRRGVDVSGLLACTAIAISLLEWLWAVGFARHNKQPAELPGTVGGPLPADIKQDHELEWGRMTVPIVALPMSGEAAADVVRRLGIGEEPAPPITHDNGEKRGQ